MPGVDNYLRFRGIRLQTIENIKAMTILQSKVKDQNIHGFALCPANRSRA